jgi:hypothetical protein
MPSHKYSSASRVHPDLLYIGSWAEELEVELNTTSVVSQGPHEEILDDTRSEEENTSSFGISDQPHSSLQSWLQQPPQADPWTPNLFPPCATDVYFPIAQQPDIDAMSFSATLVEESEDFSLEVAESNQ